MLSVDGWRVPFRVDGISRRRRLVGVPPSARRMPCSWWKSRFCSEIFVVPACFGAAGVTEFERSGADCYCCAHSDRQLQEASDEGHTPISVPRGGNLLVVEMTVATVTAG